MEGSHASWSHDAAQTAEYETYNRGSGEEKMKRGEETWLAASYPCTAHIFSPQPVSLKFNPLSWPDEVSHEAVCFNQIHRRQKVCVCVRWRK